MLNEYVIYCKVSKNQKNSINKKVNNISVMKRRCKDE